MQTETKPGHRTTEFWLVLLSNLLINVGAIDVGSAKIRGFFAVLTTLGYVLSRGIAKQGVPASTVVVPPLADLAELPKDKGDKGKP